MQSSEMNKVNNESAPNNEWLELGKIKKNHISSKEIRQENGIKNIDDKNNDLLPLISKIKKIYDKKKSSNTEKQLENKSSSNFDNREVSIYMKKNNPLLKFFTETISNRYEQMNRPSIDGYKREMRKGNYVHNQDLEYNSDYGNRLSRTSIARKLFRLIANKIGIESNKDKKERDIENYRVADKEIAYEIIEQYKKDIEKSKQLFAKQEQDAQRRKKEQDNINLQVEMEKIRNQFDFQKKMNFQKQRELEILELDLNNRLLKIDELDVQVYAKNPEVQKRIIKSGTAEVSVYDLKGYPFSILSTNILYKLMGYNSSPDVYYPGKETALELMKNPARWCLSHDQAIRESGGFNKNGSYITDTICTSFTNSETNLLSYSGSSSLISIPELTYGFDHVSPNSILNVANGDGMTGSYGKAELIDWSLNIHSVDKLISAGGTSSYNEVTIRRYSENGVPKKPDYIITRNGNIGKYALEHAKFFNIPIINIDNSVYEKKMAERGSVILEMILKEESYPKINAYIEELRSMSIYKGELTPIKTIGEFNVEDSIKRGEMPYLDRNVEINKFSNILKKEQFARLNFIRESIIKAITILEESTQERIFNLTNEKIFPDFSEFHTYSGDIQTKKTYFDDGFSCDWLVPLERNEIRIQFKLKGASEEVDTIIYGKDDQAIERYLSDNIKYNGAVLKKEEDSSFYNSFEPLIQRYRLALRNNRVKELNN